MLFLWIAINCKCPDLWGLDFTDWICWVKTHLNNLKKHEKLHFFFTLSYFFFTSSNISLLKKIRRNIYHLWPMFHIPFWNHVSTVSLYFELVNSVYPVCSSIVDILLTVLKWPCLNQNKNICKELSQNEACSLDIGTQYWTNLHGIVLKNNELNVAMASIRHWGLVIFITAWQRGVFADTFAPVHNNNMRTQLLCAWSCTANISVYTKVCALAKCNLFQSVH